MPRYKVRACGHRPSNFLGTAWVRPFENSLCQDWAGTLPFNYSWIVSVYQEIPVQLWGRG